MNEGAFTPEQLQQVTSAVRAAVRDELAAAGLRLDGESNQDAAREDFRFVRRLRSAVDGIAGKVGMTVILVIVGGIGWLILQGWNLFVRGG